MAIVDGIPNVPNFKGLVSGSLNAAISLGGAALINAIFGNYWGIFNEFGIPILLADNVTSLKYSNTAKVSQVPIEQGSFVSYDKVQDPYKATVQLTKGSGGTFERGAFIAQIEILSKSTLKFHIITPEYVYVNATIVGYDISREASDGAQLLKVNLHLEEIREVVVRYDVEEVKNPDDAKTKDGGEKQPVDAKNDSVLRVIADGLSGLFGR